MYTDYRKELARKLGLNYKDLSVDKGSQETTIMRAHRLVAFRCFPWFLSGVQGLQRPSPEGFGGGSHRAEGSRAAQLLQGDDEQRIFLDIQIQSFRFSFALSLQCL